ncbi:hypothetical protein Tsubulata_011810, partial [Turnera subulata]
IIFLRVNLQCCEECPTRAEKKLQKLHGVLAVSMDTLHDLVLLSGTLDPQVVVKKFAKWGKRAVLLSPVEDPTHAWACIWSPKS